MTDGPNGVDFVRVLGPVQVVMSSGRVVDLPSVSQRRLLAVLALHTRTSVRAEWLADALDVSPGGLRTQVSRLRKVLGDGKLSTAATGYRLDVDVDADMFCREIAGVSERDPTGRLERALAGWAGAALEEFADEEWAAGEAARLTELYASATEDLAAAMIAASRWSDAVARLEAHVALYPLRDRPRGLLMDALAGDGRQAEAFRAFQQYRSLLAEVVGTEPSVEVREIEQRIATSWATVEVDLPLPGVLVTHGPVIGQSWERRKLEEGVTRSRQSGLQTVVLSGEAGIGKTTLLGAFAADVRDRHGGAVLYARCDEGAAVPLQPFRSLVGWCVEQVSTALLETHAARCGGELRRIAPQLAARIEVPDPTSSDDATERFLLFEAVADLLRRIAGADGLVVMLDDLHWAEPTALALLRHVTRALVDAPVLLVASFRDGVEHVTEALRVVLADIGWNDAHRIALRGFDDADLADLVAVEAGASAAGVAARLRDDSAGNPLYATQLVRHWVESGLVERDVDTVRFSSDRSEGTIPPSLRDVVWSRVAALGAETTEVLSAGAVLGVEFDDAALRALVKVDAAVVDRALDAANVSGLLVTVDPAGGVMRFTHALVADALYAELPPFRRRRLHERAARALEHTDRRPQKAVVQLARHCALGGLLPDAMRWATVAGDNALAHLAPSESATWYRAALEHCAALERPDAERADLVVRLGEAMHRAGDPDAYVTLQEGAELAKRCDARAVLVRAALATDRGFMQLGAFAPQQLEIVEAAVAVAEPDDVATYARLLALFAQSLIHTPRAQLREDVARQALDLTATSADPTLLPAIASSVLYTLWGPGSSALRADVATHAVAAAAASGDPLLEFTTHIAAYTVAIELADPVAAAHSLAKLRATASEIGAPRMRWTLGIYENLRGDDGGAARRRGTNRGGEPRPRNADRGAGRLHGVLGRLLRDRELRGSTRRVVSRCRAHVERCADRVSAADRVRDPLRGGRPRGKQRARSSPKAARPASPRSPRRILDDGGHRVRGAGRRARRRGRGGAALPDHRAVRSGGRLQRGQQPGTGFGVSRQVGFAAGSTRRRGRLSARGAQHGHGVRVGVPPCDHLDRAGTVTSAPNGCARRRCPRVARRSRCCVHRARTAQLGEADRNRPRLTGPQSCAISSWRTAASGRRDQR